MVLKVKPLNSSAKLPSYANPHDAGLDVYACEEVTIQAGQRRVVKTGIALEIPEGYVGLCWDKSGLSTKYGITTLAGVIDAGFRGELVIALLNTSETDHTFHIGDKVTQLLVQPICHVTIEEVESLSESVRGEGGFGSSGF